MADLPPLGVTAIDRRGRPIHGADCYVYEPGTDTQASVYLNAGDVDDGVAALTQPLQSQYGELPYFAAGGTYELEVRYGTQTLARKTFVVGSDDSAEISALAAQAAAAAAAAAAAEAAAADVAADLAAHLAEPSGHTIEDEGVALTTRAALNFTGAGVSASDAGGKTVVTIPGSNGTLVYHGEWDPATSYDEGAVVLYDGVAYVAVAASTGEFPGVDDAGDSYADTILVDAPTYHWPLSEAVGNFAELNGGPALVPSGAPTRQVTGGAQRDTPNYAVNLESGDSMTSATFGQTTDFTVEFLMAAEAWPASNAAFPLHKDSGSGAGSRFWRFEIATTGALRAYAFLDETSTFAMCLAAAGVLQLGVWHHVAMTVDYNGSQSTVRLYVDGVLVDTETLAGAMDTDTQPLYVAVSSANTGVPATYDGSLQHVALYDTPLSADRIAAHAAAMEPFVAPPVAWERLAGHRLMDGGVALAGLRDINFTGDGVSVSEDPVNDRLEVEIAGGLLDPLVLLTAPTNASIPNTGANTAVTWGTEVSDDAGLHSAVGNTERITVAEDGVYLVTGFVVVGGNTTGFRWINLRKNGSIFQGHSGPPTGASSHYMSTSAMVSLVAGDYIDLTVAQNSGAALAIGASSYLQLVKIR